MKYAIILIIALLAVSVMGKSKTHHKKSHSKHKKSRELPSTPKADYLADHFGARSDSSPYGP
jgi:hypothetical protein